MIIDELQLEDEYCLWPENVAAFNFWQSVQTQWRWTSISLGMGGARLVRTGLDYQGVDICLRHQDGSKKDKRWLFSTVQAMEQAALEEWAKER